MGFFGKNRERESIEGLIRKIPNCGMYPNGLKFKMTGDFYICENRLMFQGYARRAHFAQKQMHMFLYENIISIERVRAYGVNCCIKIIGKNGIEFVFTLWPVRKEIDEILNIISQRLG
jgi:hypothetical protein